MEYSTIGRPKATRDQVIKEFEEVELINNSSEVFNRDGVAS